MTGAYEGGELAGVKQEDDGVEHVKIKEEGEEGEELIFSEVRELDELALLL